MDKLDILSASLALELLPTKVIKLAMFLVQVFQLVVIPLNLALFLTSQTFAKNIECQPL